MVEKNHKPLAGKRVIVTRALEQSQSLVEALRAVGAEPILLPLLVFAPPDDLSELDDCLKHGTRFDWVLFTSQNALRAVQQRCLALGVSLDQIFSGVKIGGVGTATADAVRAAGLSITYLSEIHSGRGLAEALAATVKGKRIFLPRSDRADTAMAEILTLHGAFVTSVIAYKTLASKLDPDQTQEKLFRGGADAVLFFSPSAVQNLRALLGADRFRKLAQIMAFVAIGPVTEQELIKEGIGKIQLSADTSVAAVVATLEEYFAKAGQHQPAGAKQG
ncbi:MAG TPA: uroporphyrinogen-III synthase [Candidatus Acidoferrum sp.]|nr:uroporphyrinogen-III synthase [Candidatus Acidoferrum sp.]